MIAALMTLSQKEMIVTIFFSGEQLFVKPTTNKDIITDQRFFSE